MKTTKQQPVMDILDLEPVKKPGEGLPPEAVIEQVEKSNRKMIALMVAIGEPADAVARKLNLERKEVDSFIRSPMGSELIIKMQTSMFPDPLERIKRNAHIAIDTSMRLLLRGSDSVAAKVASDMLDRSMGKATQVIENRNLNVNVTDMRAADRALEAQMARLKRLEETQQKLLNAAKSAA